MLNNFDCREVTSKHLKLLAEGHLERFAFLWSIIYTTFNVFNFCKVYILSYSKLIFADSQ